MHRQELAAAIATDGLLPLMKDDTPAPFAALLKACWSLDPAQRPSAQQMLQELQQMQQHIQPSSSNQAAAAQHSTEPLEGELALCSPMHVLLSMMCLHMSCFDSMRCSLLVLACGSWVIITVVPMRASEFT